MPEFQYDPRKSLSNQHKHGIDFEQAQLLWDDPGLVVVAARSDDEPRSLAIGQINDQHWTAIVTNRGEKTRIISVRRSRLLEIELYES
ncbi:BrnT family toxin [Gammaproteobacteria bacterium]|nr:BrnT family toxin [Gammaproteobacteria bacterium]